MFLQNPQDGSLFQTRDVCDKRYRQAVGMCIQYYLGFAFFDAFFSAFGSAFFNELIVR